MTVLIVVGYAAWIIFTLWLASLPLGTASFMTIDTQKVWVWAVAIVISLIILGGSFSALVMLS